MKVSVLAPFLTTFLALATAEDASADRRGSCPSVWSRVASSLASQFQTDGVCNDLARQAIRLVFHDCFPLACDGSILLSDECTSRGENTQMKPVCSTMTNMLDQYNVSAADLVQLGGAIGLASCMGAPRLGFKVGRKSTSEANPPNQLPASNIAAADLIALFQTRGFSSEELVAVVGSHSTGKNLRGVPLDTSVTQFDSSFYSETADRTAPASIQADVNLADDSVTSPTWQRFAASQAGWVAAYVPAMEKLSVLGNDVSSLTDCSSVVSAAIYEKRSAKAIRH